MHHPMTIRVQLGSIMFVSKRKHLFILPLIGYYVRDGRLGFLIGTKNQFRTIFAISIKSALWFLRRFFKYLPIRRHFQQRQPCCISNQHQKKKRQINIHDNFGFNGPCSFLFLLYIYDQQKLFRGQSNKHIPTQFGSNQPSGFKEEH